MAVTLAKGIDVSHYQGQIEWEKVADAGVDFAFIKATDGARGVDARFESNWRGAREAGIRRGAYHFFRPQQDAILQAGRFLAALGDHSDELPHVLDFEILSGLTADEALRRATIWMAAVEAGTGHRPILYTGPSFWRDELKNSAEFRLHPLWIAHYTANQQPTIPPPWRQWTFWQYTEKGSISGITGPVDLNWFSGSAMELDGFCSRITQQEEKVKCAALGA